MSIVKHLVAQIADELEGAEEYAELALKYKDEDKEICNMYVPMAKAELGHYTTLMACLDKVMKEYREDDDPKYTGFKEMYDWKKPEYVKKVAQINYMLDMCK